MKIAVYWGCRIPTEQYAYEMSVREVLPHFNINLVDLEEASCCGGPVNSVNTHAAMYLSTRNLALTSKLGVRDLLVPCNECHLMLSETMYRVENDSEKKVELQNLLGEEGLRYSSDIKIGHAIDLLHDLVDVNVVRTKVKHPLKGLKLAVHPGCQIIRPSEFCRVDDSEKPGKLDALVKVLGAETIDYSEKLDCCGAALLYSNEEAALSLAGSKLQAIQSYGVDGLVNSCPYCHSMFDARQKTAATTIGAKLSLPVFYYTQLLGLVIGIQREKLGFNLNQSRVLESFW